MLIKKYGKNPTLLDELEYIKWELDNGQYMGNLKSFYRSKTPEEAAQKFAKYYERCGTGSYAKRKKCAKKWFDKYGI